MEAEENALPDEPEESGAHEPDDMHEEVTGDTVTDEFENTPPEEQPAHDEHEGYDASESAPAGAEPAGHADAGEHAPAEAAEGAKPAGYDEASAKKWFIIHTYSGFENKVAESLKTRADAFGFSDKIGQILIPTEEVVELRNGKKVSSKRLVYPGYVLVEMEMNDQLWHEVKNTPRVTGFVGGGATPVPLSADEVNQILYRQQSSAERPRPKMTFEKNDSVRIVDGPFANFSGKVDEVNPERGTLRVMVTIFGRATPVELEFLQVEKV